MDSAYLKDNVNDALTEALTAMAVAAPDDKIDYIGKYLLSFAVRKSRKNENDDLAKKYDELQREVRIQQELMNEKQKLADADKYSRTIELDEFCATLESGDVSRIKNKDDAMSKTCEFLASYLSIPAVYIAVKRVEGGEGGVETLNYVAANNDLQRAIVVGKKIAKAAEAEGDDAPTKQGMSFDAFKVPDAPEEEPVELEEGQEPPPPKPAPKASFKKVANVMTDTRVKFFGIPRLGSYIAIPLMTTTIDHEAGVAPNTGSAEGEAAPPAEGEEGGAPAPTEPAAPPAPYIMNKIPSSLIVGMDTIGKFSMFTDEQVVTGERVVESLKKYFEVFEEQNIFTTQCQFLEDHKKYTALIADTMAGLAEKEAAVVASAMDGVAPPAVEPAAPVEGEEAAAPVEAPSLPESLKPFKEAQAVLNLYSGSDVLLSENVQSALLALDKHILPVTVSGLQLIFSAFKFAGCGDEVLKDRGGNISWGAIRASMAACLKVLAAYDVEAVVSGAGSKLADLRATFEPFNLADPAIVPATLPELAALQAWLQKALIARDAAIVYYREALGKDLE